MNSPLDRLDPAGMLGAVGAAVASLLRRPEPVVRAAADVASGTARAAVAALVTAAGGEGQAPVAPERSRRYADAAWKGNPYYFLARAQHAVLAAALRGAAADLALPPRTAGKVEFLVDQVVAASEPVNWPWTNPTMWRTALDTGGLSLLRGARNAVRDVVLEGGPRQYQPDVLRVGEQLAITPGKVVYRNRLIELIQYTPQTEQVHAVPMLFSPPWINKYYVMDLAPGRSLVERAVQQGHTAFMISYRNPDADMRDVGMADYLREGPLAALDVVGEITGAPRVNLVALCLGGALATVAVAWLAARGDSRINSLTLLNTLLDYTDPGPLSIFTDPETVDRVDRMMQETGYLDGSSMKTAFDMLRPGDLIWGPAVDGWLLGKEPPAFDILTWNADNTRMPAAMHAEYLRAFYVQNLLARGKFEVAGQRIDLGAVRADTYSVGAEADHIAPWTSTYTSARLLGGDVRYVLSNSGHVAGVVNPPSPRSRHQAGPLHGDPLPWREATPVQQGSWWEDWSPWVAERAGELGPPPSMGSAQHPPMTDAPGGYVREG